MAEQPISEKNSIWTKLSVANKWLAARYQTTQKKVFTIEVGALVALGFTMMQIGEHFIAIMLWIFLAFVWISRIFYAELDSRNKTLAQVERGMHVVVVLAACSILIVVTNFHRGNDLWSNLQRFWVKPPVHRHTLSKGERANFEKPLKGLKQPKMSIHLYCAPQDEVDCEYAAELIPYFGEGGWDVATMVERITLGRPKSGIVIALHGTVKLEDEPKMKWNEGEWTLLTPEEEAVRQAFVNIGIEPDSASGAIIPEIKSISMLVMRERMSQYRLI